jgi:hypothetical protein
MLAIGITQPAAKHAPGLRSTMVGDSVSEGEARPPPEGAGDSI